MPPRRRQRPRDGSGGRLGRGRVEVAACCLTARRTGGSSARSRGGWVREGLHRFGRRGAGGSLPGSRRRRVGGLARPATARVGCGPFTRPGCRRAQRAGPNRWWRGRRPVDGGVHRSIRPPTGIHRRPPGTTRPAVRTRCTVDAESRESLQPPRSPLGRGPATPRRPIRPHPAGRGRFPMATRHTIRPASRVSGRCRRRLPTANRRTVRPVGRIYGRGCRSLHSARFGPIWPPDGGAAGRGRWALRWGGTAGRGRRAVGRGRAAGVEVASGPVGWGGGVWRGSCSGRGRLGDTALAADRRCSAEPVVGGREWWTRWFRVARGGRGRPVAHGTAGGGRPRHCLGFLLADGRRSLLTNRPFVAPYRHRPGLSAGLIQSWTVRSPPIRRNGRPRLRVALDHRTRLGPGVWTRVHPRAWTLLIPTLKTRMVPDLRTRTALGSSTLRARRPRTRPSFGLWVPAASDLRTLVTFDLRTRPIFHFWARVGLLLRARLVPGVRACGGTGRPDRLVRCPSISVALLRPTRPGLVGRDRGPGSRGGRRRRPRTRGPVGGSGRVAGSWVIAAGRRAGQLLWALGIDLQRRGRRTRSGRAGRSGGTRRRTRGPAARPRRLGVTLARGRARLGGGPSRAGRARDPFGRTVAGVRHRAARLRSGPLHFRRWWRGRLVPRRVGVRWRVRAGRLGRFRAIGFEAPWPGGGVGRSVHASSLVRPPDGRRAQPIGAGALPRQPSTTWEGPIPPTAAEG
jgi:hypothetical protein